MVRQVQKEQNGRIALQGEARPFAETVNREIKIACLGASAYAAFAFLGRAIDPLLKFAETDHVATRFQTHTHFVAIVGAIEHQAMDAGADQAAKDGGWFGDMAK